MQTCDMKLIQFGLPFKCLLHLFKEFHVKLFRGFSFTPLLCLQTNVGTVDAHVADYQQMIDNLQVEVTQLRRELADKETQLSARTPEKEKLADDELSWLDVLSHDINENVQERINLQKALFELEDMNLHNRAELQQLDDLIMNLTIRRIGEKEEALVERRQVVLDNIRDNDEAATHYRQVGFVRLIQSSLSIGSHGLRHLFPSHPSSCTVLVTFTPQMKFNLVMDQTG
jgi:hypothetical protein